MKYLLPYIVIFAILVVFVARLHTIRGGVVWHPPLHNTSYEIDGSFPGPKTYVEDDVFLGAGHQGGDVAYMYNQHAETSFWAGTQVALVQEKDGTWTKYMACSVVQGKLACQGYYEKSFMPKAIYRGENWTGYL